MTTTTAKATVGMWGKAPAVRFPQAICAQLGLKTGDTVEMTCEDGIVTMRPSSDKYTLHERLKGWENGRYRAEEIDWGEPAGDEIW